MKKNINKKEVLKIKKDITMSVLNKILDNYFIQESIKIIDENMIIFPVGTFVKEENEWIFDVDFTYLTDHVDIINLMCLIKDVTKKGINILFSQGYHTVFNDDDICCGILFEDDVEEYVEENDCDYEEAFDILSEKLAKEYKEELKNEKVKENLQ